MHKSLELVYLNCLTNFVVEKVLFIWMHASALLLSTSPGAHVAKSTVFAILIFSKLYFL